MGLKTVEFTKNEERRKKEKQLEKDRKEYLNSGSYTRIEIITSDTLLAPYYVRDVFHSTPAGDIIALAMLRHSANDLETYILKNVKNITKEDLEKDIKEITEA